MTWGLDKKQTFDQIERLLPESNISETDNKQQTSPGHRILDSCRSI